MPEMLVAEARSSTRFHPDDKAAFSLQALIDRAGLFVQSRLLDPAYDLLTGEKGAAEENRWLATSSDYRIEADRLAQSGKDPASLWAEMPEAAQQQFRADYDDRRVPNWHPLVEPCFGGPGLPDLLQARFDVIDEAARARVNAIGLKYGEVERREALDYEEESIALSAGKSRSEFTPADFERFERIMEQRGEDGRWEDDLANGLIPPDHPFVVTLERQQDLADVRRAAQYVALDEAARARVDAVGGEYGTLARIEAMDYETESVALRAGKAPDQFEAADFERFEAAMRARSPDLRFRDDLAGGIVPPDHPFIATIARQNERLIAQGREPDPAPYVSLKQAIRDADYESYMDQQFAEHEAEKNSPMGRAHEAISAEWKDAHERGTPRWERVWSGLAETLAAERMGTGRDLAQNNQGEYWQYMNTRGDTGEAVHYFRHREHPQRPGSNTWIYIPDRMIGNGDIALAAHHGWSFQTEPNEHEPSPPNFGAIKPLREASKITPLSPHLGTVVQLDAARNRASAGDQVETKARGVKPLDRSVERER